MLEHANPVNFMLALLSATGFVYGLWMHDWIWIGGSLALALLGSYRLLNHLDVVRPN